MKRTLAASFFAAAIAVSAHAKTVEIETIEINPTEDGSVIEIPADALETTSPTTGSDPLEKVPELAETSLPQILYSTAEVPKPVARMHSQMREVALSGNIDRFRVILESNEVMPTLSFGEIEDPIDFLKESSGDGEGYEILAILADILDAGFVHVDAGTPQEMYVWPYFARYPLDSLSPDQKVELFRIVTSGDFAEMEEFGTWLFYRVGIGPDGTLHYFVAGD